MYITTAHLMEAFSHHTMVQISNDSPRATEPNLNVLEMAIKLACERIDAALRARYILPLSDVSTLITQQALTLARYWLYARRPETKMPEGVKDAYQQALKELEQIANGKLHLGIATLTANTAVGHRASGDVIADESEYTVRSSQRIDTFGY
ncbi:phage gp36-like protein [Nicoletella semolina]|uniref:Phage gp36-like protein n=1 Tax=Nicoletella semolina TaxID=271160 RepID=A0A4R2N8S9_9PAST|nr:DUF1320 domain-containing protein [Nicoletella semolina]MDH2924543.1 hypothetical protein [Nicoletella semolina]TCP17328.1 phage gp36-like protein [Nicoletella semolina]